MYVVMLISLICLVQHDKLIVFMLHLDFNLYEHYIKYTDKYIKDGN